jgi:ABC-2 type transport system ATP-binding protein
MILGQIKPTLGTVRLFGKNPWRRSKLLRRVGFCPALEFSYPNVSSLEWVTYLVQMHGFTRSDALTRSKQALELVGLGHVLDQRMTEYSLGMRQRAKLAQAIAHDPELLILDEPFNGLDPVGRFEMMALLKKWASEGRSLVLASHVLHELEAVNPAFLLIYSGRLLASGAPDEMRRILANSPSVLTIRSSDSKKLASILAELPAVSCMRFIGADQLEIETMVLAEVMNLLPRAALDAGISIDGVETNDQSLKSLFATLMKIQRGELLARKTL